jgi:hypothetical protein
VDTNLLDDGGGLPIYYYVLLVIDCATRYKDFIFLTSKSSEEVAEAFKSIYDNLINLLTGLENCNVIRALSLWDT